MQRKQSLWLLISALLMIGIFYFPIYKYTEFGDVGIGHNYLAILFAVASIAISLAAIFLYKNRKLQMQLCLLNVLLCIFILGLIFYTINMSQQTSAPVTRTSTGATNGYYWVGAFIPIVNIVLSFMAWVGIKKDDKLIRSADHLR